MAPQGSVEERIVEKIAVRAHFNKMAPDYDYWKRKNWYYHFFIKRFLRSRIASRRDVLELGCGDRGNPGEFKSSARPRG